MLSAKSSLSIKKSDLQNQKTTASGFRPLYFHHKATAGETGVNLLSLTSASEMASVPNPTQAELVSASLLFYKKNLSLISSVRGFLIQGLSYEVASSSQINFIGFTALANEIFTGVIQNAQMAGTRVVGSGITPVTGTLLANSTDFPVGTPFKAGKNANSKVGAVAVYLDGVLQNRNTGNLASPADGNYYEYDPGSGDSSLIKFNSSTGSDRKVTVIYLDGMAERPDGSMMASIESIQGQVNAMIPVLADASGQPQSYFRVAPTQQDLKTFGDTVTKLVTYTGIKTSAYTAVKWDKVLTDSSGGAFTVTLPASPSAGDFLEVYDATGSWGTNNVTLGRNGSNINGAASDFILNVSDKKVEIVYINSAQGWRVYG